MEPLVVTGDSYWIYDWDSVQAMKALGKPYRFTKPGPKPKAKTNPSN